MNIALIMMGGTGTRFGADIPKQFVEVNNRPIFTYLLNAYQQLDAIDHIVIVCHEEWLDFTREWAEKLGATKTKAVIRGGNSRSQSVLFGLEEITTFSSDEDIVLIHDVTHPFIDSENVLVSIEAARTYGAASLVGQCFDTMYHLDDTDFIQCVISREQTVSATSPEVFRLGVIYPLFVGKSDEELERMTCAGAMLVANGQLVKVIRTPLINLKVTLHEDMEAFKKLLHGYYYD